MNDFTFSFGVWASVSTDTQAREEKASLPNQIKVARAAGIAQGGREAAGPFVGDGYSRTGYVDLSVARQEIPPLNDALTAIEQNRIDALICENIERFGDLMPMIATFFKNHNKQIHSARQSGPIKDPSTYNAKEDDSLNILTHVEGLIQGYRINKLNRGWAIGMPRRIENGLNPSKTPYAYTYVNSKSPPIQNPDKVAKFLQARDALMEGKTYTEIGEILGVSKSRVPYILSNAFYAGTVIFHKVKTHKVNGTWRYIKLPKSKHLVGQGKHEPIITMEEHQEIIAELDRRFETNRRKTGWVFTGLLHCAMCGGMLKRRLNSGKFTRLFCREQANHVSWKYDKFFAEVGRVLGDALSKPHNEELTTREDQTEALQKAMDENKKRRRNVQEGIEAGAYTAHEGAARIRELESNYEKLQNDIERQAQERVNRAVARDALQGLDLSTFEITLRRGDPALVNRMLSAWLREIRVSKDKIELIAR